jgi:hypothetical protein
VAHSPRDAIRKAAGAAGLALAITVYAGLAGSALSLALCAMALVLALVTEPRRRASAPSGAPKEREDLGRRAATLLAERFPAAAGGVAGLFLAPYLVLSHRYSNAPSGTEVIFLTSACWGAVAATAAGWALWRSGSRVRALVVQMGSIAALAGSAGMLANWERPSSFSPFVRFVPEQLWMLAAGVAFLVGALLMGRARREGVASPYVTATSCATIVAASVWLLSGDAFQTLEMLIDSIGVVTLWGLSGAAFWMAWNRRASTDGLIVPSAVLFAPALLLPGLLVVERSIAALGPNPLVWEGIAGGALLMCAGAARILAWRGAGEGAKSSPASPARWLTFLRVLMACFVVMALIGLFLPAIRADVTGDREGARFAFSWLMAGWESVPGWAAVGIALLAVAATFDDALPPTIATLAAAPAYWLLGRTPMHVWNTFVPAPIQQDYGTEYAQVSFVALESWPSRVAVAGAVTGLAIVLTRRLLKARP